jgi:hypothetical protein
MPQDEQYPAIGEGTPRNWRVDLKQVQAGLAVSADGGIPIHARGFGDGAVEVGQDVEAVSIFSGEVSRVRMALAIDVSRLGLIRALRRIRQVLMRAMALSTGHRMREWAWLTDFCLTVRSLLGRRLWGSAMMSPAPW